MQKNSIQIGKTFALKLFEFLGNKKIAKVRARNRKHADAGLSCCASHDFCDANMVMLAAYAEVMDIPEDDVDLCDDTTLALMNAAWDYAKKEYLTAAVQ